MPAISGEPWRALAKNSLTAVGGQRHFTVSTSTSNDGIALTGSQTDWDGNPRDITLKYNEDFSGLTPPGASDSRTVELRLVGTSTVISTWSPASDGATTTITLSKAGMLEIHLRVTKTTGLGTEQYDIGSRGTVSSPPTGFTHNWARGYVRTRLGITSHTLVNQTAAEPSLWAYPDDIDLDVVLREQQYETFTLAANLGPRSANSAGTVTARAFDWTGPGGQIDTGFSTGLHNLTLSFSSTGTFGGDEKLLWADTVAAPFVRTSGLLLTAANRIDVNPSATTQAATRTSGMALVNYARHDVSFTFEVHNARGEKLTSAHGTDARVDVVSYDIPGTADETTIQNNITPNGSGVYTVSTFQYTGSTSPSNRDFATGGGPRADHTAAGRQKGIHPTLDTSGAPDPGPTGALVNLTSLLYLDVHPQQSSTLVQDTDPLADPGDGEDVSYAIAAQLCRVWGYVEDIQGQVVSGASVEIGVYKPEQDILSAEGSVVRTTGGDGWTTNYLEMAPVAPAGSWRARCVVDVDDGAGGNYGDEPQGGSGIEVPGSLVQQVGFNSPYTADRSVSIRLADEAAVGAVTTIVATYNRADGARLDFDSTPTIHIYSMDDVGAETDEVAVTTMTVAASKVWTYDWTPSAPGIYQVEVKGVFGGADVLTVIPVTARPRFSLNIGPLSDRM